MDHLLSEHQSSIMTASGLEPYPWSEPSEDESAVLSPFERFAFRLTHRMNRGGWKHFWTWCQKVFGAGWIHLSTYNLMSVYGLEHIDDADRTKPCRNKPTQP